MVSSFLAMCQQTVLSTSFRRPQVQGKDKEGNKGRGIRKRTEKESKAFGGQLDILGEGGEGDVYNGKVLTNFVGKVENDYHHQEGGEYWRKIGYKMTIRISLRFLIDICSKML